MSIAELVDRFETASRARVKGADGGRDNNPPTSSTDLSETEQEIVALAQDEVAVQTAHYKEKVESHQRELDVLNAAMPVGSLFSKGELEARLMLALAEYEQYVKEKYRKFLGKRQNYRHFQEIHGLQRDAVEHQAGFDVFGVMVLVVVLDGALNAFFFKDTNVRGLVGGFLLAAIISLCNVALGYVGGLWPWRYFNHRTRLHLVWVVPLLCIFIGAIVLFNLAVAHYRELLTENPDVQAGHVIAALWSSPFGIVALQSWMLAGVGVAIALYSWYKGYNTFDPYPRYGKISREYHVALKAYDDAVAQLRAKVDAAAKDYLDTAKQALLSTRNLTKSMARCREQLQDIAAQWAERCKAVSEACGATLKIFRDANLRVRNTTAPAYFDVPCELDWGYELYDQDMVAKTLEAAECQAAGFAPAYDELVRSAPEIVTDMISPEAIKKRIAELQSETERVDFERGRGGLDLLVRLLLCLADAHLSRGDGGYTCGTQQRRRDASHQTAKPKGHCTRSSAQSV